MSLKKGSRLTIFLKMKYRCYDDQAGKTTRELAPFCGIHEGRFGVGFLNKRGHVGAFKTPDGPVVDPVCVLFACYRLAEQDEFAGLSTILRALEESQSVKIQLSWNTKEDAFGTLSIGTLKDLSVFCDEHRVLMDLRHVCQASWILTKAWGNIGHRNQERLVQAGYDAESAQEISPSF